MKKMIFASIFGLVIILTACGRNDIDNSSIQSSSQADSEVSDMISSEMSDGVSDSGNWDFHSMNETVNIPLIGSNGEENLEYTVTNAYAVEDIDAAGIERNKFLEIEKGKILVLIELTIKNLDSDGFAEQDEFAVSACLKTRESLGNKKPEMGEFFFNKEMSYFSEYSAENVMSFARYILPMGETMNCQLGFWMGKSVVEQNDFVLVISEDELVGFEINLENIQ